MNVLFILGAGLSNVTLPLSRQLDRVVSTGHAPDGTLVTRRGTGLYELARESDPTDVWTPRVLSCITWLREWLGPGHNDYEALYFAVQQLHDHVMEEYENELLRPVVRECLTHILNWWGPDMVERTTGIRRPMERLLADLLRETQDYVSGAVAGSLHLEAGLAPGRIHDPLVAACRECLDAPEGYVDIVTLNHDTLLEHTFREHGIHVEDGFGDDPDAPEGVPIWVGYELEKPVPRLRLVKLHGSIDWWSIAPPDKGSDIVARVETPFRLEDPTGRTWDTPESRPRMLIGTTNKMLDYVRPLNIDRLAVFRRSLIRCHGVVVSGYSFRDKGVNGLLADWCWRRNGRLVVVAPGIGGAAAPETARGAIRKAWAHMHSTHRLLPIDSAFADSSWRTIRAFLARGTAQ